MRLWCKKGAAGAGLFFIKGQNFQAKIKSFHSNFTKISKKCIENKQKHCFFLIWNHLYECSKAYLQASSKWKFLSLGRLAKKRGYRLVQKMNQENYLESGIFWGSACTFFPLCEVERSESDGLLLFMSDAARLFGTTVGLSGNCTPELWNLSKEQ